MNASRRISLTGLTVFPDGIFSEGLMHGVSANRQIVSAPSQLLRHAPVILN